MKKILIIEDDAPIAMGLEEALKREHFGVLSARTGNRGFTYAREERVDLIILDLKLPDRNGEDICRDLRSSGIQIPILMLTSKNDVTDKVKGLEIGADDYVTKPFNMRELLARIRAILRRNVEVKSEIEEYAFGDVYVDFKKGEALKKKRSLRLTVKELEVLHCFIRHEGEVLSRDTLLNEVWGYHAFPSTRTVDNFVLSLRKKIENDQEDPKHILTVHTAGYKFVK